MGTRLPDALRARRAGLLWLLAAATGGWALTFVRGQVYVPGDAMATASAVAAHVMGFRLAIVATLVSQVTLLFLALEFHRVFAPAERALSRLLLVSMLASVTLAVANQLPNLAALLVLGPEPALRAFPLSQREALILVLLRIQNGPGQALLELFWTPYYAALGLIVLRTHALPRVFGVLLLAMGIGFAVNILQKLLVPDAAPLVFTRMAMALGALGAIPTMLWLLVRGLRAPVRADAD